MSRLFIAFLIVLLPLRGWAGDLMSVQMAASVAASHGVSDMPADCPMLATAGAPSPDANGTQVQIGIGCCASCELCIPIAELAGTDLGVTGFAVHAQPLMGGADFMSASPATTLEPPIP